MTVRPLTVTVTTLLFSELFQELHLDRDGPDILLIAVTRVHVTGAGPVQTEQH